MHTHTHLVSKDSGTRLQYLTLSARPSPQQTIQDGTGPPCSCSSKHPYPTTIHGAKSLVQRERGGEETWSFSNDHDALRHRRRTPPS